jgi:hypothetical protein
MTGIPESVLAALALCAPPDAPQQSPCPPPTKSPPPVACWAQPAVTPNFETVQVGGSVGAKRGRQASTQEGVWGLDFLGRWRIKRVKLLWPFKTFEREPVHGKDPTRYENKLPETPPPPVIKKL